MLAPQDLREPQGPLEVRESTLRRMQRLCAGRGPLQRVPGTIGDRLVIPLVGTRSCVRREQMLGDRLSQVWLAD